VSFASLPLYAKQAGLHNTDGNQRRSWGHAVAFDPWGERVASFEDGAEGNGIAIFEIDLDLVARTRQNMPMKLHRRYDIYGDGPHALTTDGEEAAPSADTSNMGFG